MNGNFFYKINKQKSKYEYRTFLNFTNQSKCGRDSLDWMRSEVIS